MKKDQKVLGGGGGGGGVPRRVIVMIRKLYSHCFEKQKFTLLSS